MLFSNNDAGGCLEFTITFVIIPILICKGCERLVEEWHIYREDATASVILQEREQIRRDKIQRMRHGKYSVTIRGERQTDIARVYDVCDSHNEGSSFSPIAFYEVNFCAGATGTSCEGYVCERWDRTFYPVYSRSTRNESRP